MAAKPSFKVEHPGKRLGGLLKAHKITSYRCAQDLGEQPSRVYEVVKGQRPLTPLLAMRLGHYFGERPEVWLYAQAHYDLASIPKDQVEAARAIRPLPLLQAKE